MRTGTGARVGRDNKRDQKIAVISYKFDIKDT